MSFYEWYVFVVDGLPDLTTVPEPEQGGDAGFTGL